MIIGSLKKISKWMRFHIKRYLARKDASKKEGTWRHKIKRKRGEENGNFLLSGGEENERQMANNVNCKEMRFVIRNLVMLKILPGNGAKIFLDGSWNYVGISLERGDDVAQRL